MSCVYFWLLPGSDANETNIKLHLVLQHIFGRPEKKKIISRWRGISRLRRNDRQHDHGDSITHSICRARLSHTESHPIFRCAGSLRAKSKAFATDKLEMILQKARIQSQPSSVNLFWYRR